MVRLGPKPKKLDAAICKVLVINGGAGLRFGFAFDSGDVVLNTGSDGASDRSTEFGRAFALGSSSGVHFGGFDANRSRNLGDAIAEIFGEFRGGA